jgi:hypothetical protein
LGIRLKRAAQVAELRAQGLGFLEIARALGISRSYASTLYHDPDGSLDRARKEAYGGICIDCGGPTSGAEGPAHVAERCLHCTPNANRKWTPETVVAAIQEWARRRGQSPTANEWLHGGKVVDPDGYEFPAASSCYRSSSKLNPPFETWADAIEAAGFPRPRVGWKRPKEKIMTATRPYLVFRTQEDDSLALVGEVIAENSQKAVEMCANGSGEYAAVAKGSLQKFTLQQRWSAVREPVRQ